MCSMLCRQIPSLEILPVSSHVMTTSSGVPFRLLTVISDAVHLPRYVELILVFTLFWLVNMIKMTTKAVSIIKKLCFYPSHWGHWDINDKNALECGHFWFICLLIPLKLWNRGWWLIKTIYYKYQTWACTMSGTNNKENFCITFHLHLWHYSTVR